MLLIKNGKLTETEYDIGNEGKNASVFTTGNGYMGVRGSFEEFGSIRVQGVYSRGFVGEITEVMEPFPDNEYLKNYYFDESKLKDFEKQESVINIPDFLLVRIYIGGEVFYPWKGRIVEWERSLDPFTGRLERKVVWENDKGEITRINFSRFASFADVHKYCVSVGITPINHNDEIKIISGIDKRVKTCGQKVLDGVDEGCKPYPFYRFRINNSYGYGACVATKNSFEYGGQSLKTEVSDEYGCVAEEVTIKAEESKMITLKKIAELYTDRDGQADVKVAATESLLKAKSYDEIYKEHLAEYKRIFDKTDVEIEGDDETLGYVRYANYQTIISACVDDVHGMSAKGLSGEKYNGFVWWDCEIYQLPFFITALPDLAKNSVMYRYRMLGQAKVNAAEAGYKGAKFAFCSSVRGDERVWIYARHPFLQIHVNADVAYGIINYYRATGDDEFMKNYGLEMLCEIARYWASRAEYKDGKYYYNNVTGTDEHHLFVNNDAYTNYIVRFVLKKTIGYLQKFDCKGKAWNLTSAEKAKVSDVIEKLYIPKCENGLVPQFDGYFDLSRELSVTNGSVATSFQMKRSGLYHLSQVIKQPDVMLLFTYIDDESDDFTAEEYEVNWDYYEKMCETASSLTFPVHAIASADNGRMLSFLDYLKDSAKIDIADLHKCAWQGVHSGCLAGVRFSIFRGIFGFKPEDDVLKINPNYMPMWKKVKLKFEYKGVEITATIEGRTLMLEKTDDKPINFSYRGEKVVFDGKTIKFAI